MALKGTILGLGIYNNQILRGTIEYVPESEIILQENIKIGFYSILGAYIGSITNQHDNCGYIGLKIKEKRYGGLDSFEFELSKLPDFTLFNQMVCRFHINGIHWFTGELSYKSDGGTKKPIKKFTGDGYKKYFKNRKIKVEYANKTIKEIIQDVMDNYIIDDTPITYNSDDIIPYDYMISSIKFNNKSIMDIMETLTNISNQNYTNNKYYFYIDENIFFHFGEMPSEIQKGFFEGVSFQNPDAKTNDKSVINQIDIFRNQSDSQENEFVSRIEDKESQDKYGIRHKDLNYNDFADKTTCEKLADFLVKKYNEELIEIKVKSLKLSEKLNMGHYKIATRKKDYTLQISDFADFLDWDKFANNTTLSIDDTEALSGKKSIKIVTTIGSNNEYIEKILDDPVFFPDTLSLYLKQNAIGTYIYIRAYDEDGNVIGSGTTTLASLLLESGGYLLLESGGKFQLESNQNTLGVDVKIIGTWYRYKFDISALTNLAKIRIIFATNENITFWIDRMELTANIWKHNNLLLDEIEYDFEKSGVKANAVFGEKNPSIIDKIKELDDKNKFITEIFNKR